MVQDDGRIEIDIVAWFCFSGIDKFLYNDIWACKKIDGIFKIKKFINGKIYIEKDAY